MARAPYVDLWKVVWAHQGDSWCVWTHREGSGCENWRRRWLLVEVIKNRIKKTYQVPHLRKWRSQSCTACIPRNQLLDHFFHTANFCIPTKTLNYSQLFKLLYRIRGHVMWNPIMTLRMNIWVMNDIGMRAVVLWALIIVLARAILHELKGVMVTVVLRVLEGGC